MTPPNRIAHGTDPVQTRPADIHPRAQPWARGASGAIPASRATAPVHHGSCRTFGAPRLTGSPIGVQAVPPVRTGLVRSGLHKAHRGQGPITCAQPRPGRTQWRPENACAGPSAHRIETNRTRAGTGISHSADVPGHRPRPHARHDATRPGPAQPARRATTPAARHEPMHAPRQSPLRAPMHPPMCTPPDGATPHRNSGGMTPVDPVDRPRATPVSVRSAPYGCDASCPDQGRLDPASPAPNPAPIACPAVACPPIRHPAQQAGARLPDTSTGTIDPPRSRDTQVSPLKALHRAVPGRCAGAGGWAVHRRGAVRCRLSDAGGRT